MQETNHSAFGTKPQSMTPAARNATEPAAASGMKKNAETSSFEKTLREFEITRYGLKVGEPLTGLRGILSGGITLGKMSED